MIRIQNRSNCVKPEPINLKLSHPISKIGKQKPFNLVLLVVEAHGVPLGVVPFGSFVLVTEFSSVELTDAIHYIGTCMWLHYVNDYLDVELVGGIDEILKITWRTWSRGWCKEAGDMVSEGGVIGVLLDGHQLNYVIPGIPYLRKYFVSKLPVASNLTFFLGHTYVCFVNSDWSLGRKSRLRVLKNVGLRGAPENTIEHVGLRVLDVFNCPDWVSVFLLPVWTLHLQFIPRIMQIFSLFRTQRKHKATKLIFLRIKFITIPAIEVSKDADRFGHGCPFEKF